MADLNVTRRDADLCREVGLMVENIISCTSILKSRLEKYLTGPQMADVAVYLEVATHQARSIPGYMRAVHAAKPAPLAGKPSSAAIEAAGKDLAVQKLIKKASRKTPIRGK